MKKKIISKDRLIITDVGHETISEESSLCVFLINDGLITNCSIKFARMCGYKVNEIINRKRIRDLISPEDLPILENSLSFLSTLDVPTSRAVMKIKKKNDSILKVNVQLSQTYCDGKLAVIGSIIEVSEVKTPIVPVDILSQAVNNLTEGIIITDLNRTVIYTNESLYKILGYSCDELIGKDVTSIFESCLAQSDFEKIFEKSLRNNRQHEIVCRKKDGTHIQIDLNNSLITDKKNSVIAELFTINDISDTDRMMGELRRKEFKYHNMFEKMQDAFASIKIIFDEHGNPHDMTLLEANKSFEELTQIPNKKLIGKKLSKLGLLENIEPNPFPIIANVALNGSEEVFEVKIKILERWFLISAYSTEEGFAFIIIHDIAERKRAQQESNRSRTMLRSILDNIPQRVFWKDANSKFLGCNTHFAKDINLMNPSDIEGKVEYDFYSKELADDFINTDKSILKSGKPIRVTNVEQKIFGNPGKIWVRLNKLPLRNENNEIVGIVGTYEDISKQRIIEDNLRKLSQVVEQSPVSIVITDLDGNIEYVNNKFNLVTGYSLREVIGKNPRILKSGEKTTEEYVEMWKTISSGKEWTGEFHNKKKNGDLYWERASISPIRDSNGSITHFLALKEDITEHKATEESLLAREKLLRETQTIAKLGNYKLDIPNGVWQSSKILDDIFGIDDKYIRSVEGWSALIHPECREEMVNYFLNLLANKQIRFDREYKIVRSADGAKRWVHGLGEIEFDSKNRPIKMIGTIQDITERKLTEEELKESFSLLEGTLESTIDGILVVDSFGKIQKFNKKFLHLWEIPESIIQMRNDDAALKFVLGQLKYPDLFLGKVKELYKDTLAESFDLIEFKDGRVFERYSRPQVIGNNAVGRVWSFRDITESKKASEALVESEKKLRTLFETSNEGILASDVNGNNILVNPRMAEMTGYTVDELMVMNFDQLIPPEEMENHLVKMEERSKGLATVYERKLLRKGGSTIWALVSASPYIDSEGNYQGSLGMFTDITKQKLTQEELIVAKEKAEEINRLKSIFLTNISHELRTPLIGILGYAETLYNELEKPDFKDMACTILHSGTRLKETLNLILDLSHIEADKLNVNFSPQNLTKLVREKFKQFHSEALEKGLKFQIILEEEDIEINADERMLSQVIEHLLANALKYTNRGEITVSISKIVENGKQYAQMKVKDTGIGIPNERAHLIFQPFRQISEGLSRSHEGIGLGLTVSKKFIELMGGEILIESRVGKGSTFIIKLPIEGQSSTSLTKEASPIILSPKSPTSHHKYSSEVLLIEDDEPTSNVIKIYLSEICKTDWAHNGKTAIEMATAKNYSAFLVDINLGIGMDGIETVNKIKKINGYEFVPIIAVTAYALYGDRERFLKQGFTHYISKPFDKSDIVELVDKVLAEKF